MAPPAPTVVVASERPMAAPRRRGRSQARSLGVVVTLRDPLGTPKLQTGPSAALVSSLCAPKSASAQRTYRIYILLAFRRRPPFFFCRAGRAPFVHLPTGRASSAASSTLACYFFCVTIRPLG